MSKKINVFVYFVVQKGILFNFICTSYKTPVKVFLRCCFRTVNALKSHTCVETNVQNVIK